MPFLPGPAGGHRLRRPAAAAAVLAACANLAAVPRAVRAQPVLGAGDDATLPAAREIRVRGTPTLTSWNDRFGGRTGALGGRVPLASEFSTDAIGPAQLPALAAVRDTLRAITGRPALALSLGQLRVNARANAVVAPVVAEYGITRRLAFGVTVPFIRTRTAVGVDVNGAAGGGAQGNFGLNPARDPAARADALARNGAVQSNVAGALTALRGQCPTATAAPGCADALSLAAEADRFRAGVAAVYGTSANDQGAAVVPLAGSDAQAAVARQLGALGQRFAARGIPLDTTRLPAPSLARIALPGFKQLFADSALGVGAFDPLGSFERASVGDVEVAASLQVLDTFGGAGRDGGLRARVAPTGVRLRSTVTAGWRFGTGTAVERTTLLFDVPPAEGASALLLRSATDVTVGRRLSASVIARLAAPVADRRALRIPAAAGEPYVPIYRTRDVGRKLGREVQLEFTPRYAAGDAFAVFGQALLRDRAAATYTGSYTATAEETGGEAVTFDAAPLGSGTAAREARVGFGVAYSTMAAYARGRSTLPVEVSWLHSTTAAASNGAVPRVSSDQLSLRVYLRLFGR